MDLIEIHDLQKFIDNMILRFRILRKRWNMMREDDELQKIKITIGWKNTCIKK
ncbi:MAG TPA: hypothetical protein VIY08_15775 [Candidatus Nitrosocosmicus sp.]